MSCSCCWIVRGMRHVLCALLILVYRFQDRKAMPEEREAIFRFYLKNMRRCNNWDLVDLTCRDIVGEYLVDKDRSLLYRLAESENLWEQRISIVSTWAFIRRNDFWGIPWSYPNG